MIGRGKRSYRSRRGSTRRVSTKKAQRVVAKKKSKQAKSNSDTFAVTAKMDYVQRPYLKAADNLCIAGDIPFMSDNHPMVVQNTREYVLYSKMYDQVRINRVSIRVKPVASSADYAIAQAVQMKGDSLIHTALDRNGAVPADITSYQQYPSYKSYGFFKTWSRSYSIKWPKSVWLQTENLFTDKLLLTQIGANGRISWFGENLMKLPNLPTNPLPAWAAVEITYHMVFKGRHACSVTAQADGSIRLQPNEQFLEPTVLRGYSSVRGTINDGINDYEDPDQQEGA